MKTTFRKKLSKFVIHRLDPPPSAKHPNTMLLTGQILVRDKFLPEEQFIELQRWAYQMDTPFTREQRNWSEIIKRDFAENKASRQWASNHDDVPPVLQKFIAALREAEIVTRDDLIHIGVYRWERLSGMGMHLDSHTDTAVTFYLNDVWDSNWGGDFVYYEGKQELALGVGHAVMPAANRVVVNHSTIHHKVSYCSITAPDRVTLQAFVFKGQTR